MITRQRALEILVDHGRDFDTEYHNDDGELIDPSFDSEVGVKPEYKLMEVLGWLGYCCRFC